MDPFNPPDGDPRWSNPADRPAHQNPVSHNPADPNSALPPYGAPSPQPGVSAPQPIDATPAPIGHWEPSQAVTSLVVNILGLVVSGGLISPLGWYYARKEIEGIEAGRRDPSKRDIATAGKIVGIIGTLLLVATALFFLGILAIAVIATLAEGA